MPTTRRQSALPSTPTPEPGSSTPSRRRGGSSTPRPTATPLESRRGRTGTATPLGSSRLGTPVHPHPHPHHPQHHKTADELALEEADKLLHTPLAGRDADGDVAALLSPRSERRRRLQEARDRAGADTTDVDADEQATDRGSEVAFEERLARGGDCTSAGIVETLLGGTSITSGTSAQSATDLGPQGDESSATLQDDREGLDHEAHAESSVRSASIAASDAAGSESESESESSSGSEDDSDDSSDSSEGDSEADSEESDTDDEEDRLERLLAAAKLSAAQSATDTGKGKGKLAENGGEEDLLRLEAESKEAPIPDIAVPKLPTPHLLFSADGSARASAQPPAAGPSRPRTLSSVPNGPKTSEHALEIDDRPYERELTKREKAAQPRKATASELWAKLPAPKTELLGQMKRDYQAFALANSLDPKRFMKGGTKLNKVPEAFAIGTVVDAPRHLQDTTLAREHRYRPGSIVREITADQSTNDYAKRKYGDLQTSRMDNGRGKGWRKRSTW